jgi:regulator of nonsense transcripts 2
LIKAAFYNVKPPPAGARKQMKQYPPFETYLRNLLLVRLEPSDSSISFVSKQLVRLPWGDASHNCGALVAKLLLKACRKGRYKTMESVAAVTERLRTQRVADELPVRLIDAVLEELRGALERPDSRDQQRIIIYTRLLGELYCSNQVSAQLIIQQLYDFINLGHEIPDSLKEASRALVGQTGTTLNEGENLPVYNSATGISHTIREDEEMDDAELADTLAEAAPAQIQPVAVSEKSKYDPRVPASNDPPNSSFRIQLVCTLLEASARTIVSRSNLTRLKGFLAAFQRYLFTKTLLPADVEFALLDTFDILDSRWRLLQTNQRGGGEEFPRFESWLAAHSATILVEESDAANNSLKIDQLEAAGLEKNGMAISGLSVNDDETASQFDDDESIVTGSDSEVDEKALIERAIEQDFDAEYDNRVEESDGENGINLSDTCSDDEEEFDEEAYMRRLEDEAFERELRRVTMDALEKGKNVSRKQIAEYMPSGSNLGIIKKKSVEPAPAASLPGQAPVAGHLALGGKVGVTFQLLKKGSKGRVETRDLVVPADTNLAQAATKHDDVAARERHVIKQRVLQYEAESAYAETSGGNVYLEQEKLQFIRNRPLSIDTIDRNFGTSCGSLRQSTEKSKHVDEPPVPATQALPSPSRVRASGVRGGRLGGNPGRGRGRNSGGRTLT